MKKKYVLWGLVVFAIAISLVWSTYKIVLLSVFRTIDLKNNEYIKEALGNTQELSVKSNRELANIKFHNLNFKIGEEVIDENLESNSKIYKNEKGTMVLWIIKDVLYKDSLVNDSVTNKFGFNYEKLSKKYDINNEYDFIEYTKKDLKYSPNIFWSKSHLQMSYAAYNWISYMFITMQVYDNIKILNGDLTGVMSEGDNFVQIHLVNEDETYFIRLNKALFDSERRLELLNSIYFD